MWRVCAAGIWLVALALAAGGLGLARLVLDRGVTYGEAGAARLRDVSIRAVNVQLEMEPDEASVARTLDMVRDAGFGWIRQQVSWADIEPGHKGNFWDGDRRGGGQATWTRLDAVARLAAARGIRVIARIELPPEWARPPGSFRSHPPTNVHDYADFVASVTSRYRGQIDVVQVWNEPNLSEEWGRRPVDPAAYVELLRAGYEGARRGNAKAVVVAASLAQTLEPDLDTAAGLNDLAYLDRMYAFGAAPFFDIAAANGYGLWTGPDDRQVGGDYTNLSRLLLVREVMARHGDSAKPLWVSEFGWNAEPPGWDGRPSPWGRVDEATQAAWLHQAWRRAEREWPWVGPMSVWLMRQPRPIADDPTQFFALVHQDWSTSPAYDALVAEARAPVLGPGTWPDGARGIEYVGTWQVSPREGGSLRETPAPNAHLRLRFDGTRVELVAPVGPQRGVAYVTVDGSYLLAGQLPRNRFGQAMIDFGAVEAREGVRFLVASGLPDGEHRLELTVSGDAGTGSSAPGVGIDGVVVARDRSTAPETALAVAVGGSLAAAAWSVRRAVRAGLDTPFAPRMRRVPWALATASGPTPRTRSSDRAGRPLPNQVAPPTNADRPSANLPLPAPRSTPAGAVAGKELDTPRPRMRREESRLPVVTWAVLATVAALPFGALAVPTPVGRFSPVELLALVAIALGALTAWLGEGRDRFRPYRVTVPPRLSDLDGEHWALVLLLVGGTVGAVVARYPTPAWREWRLLVAEPLAWYLVAAGTLRRIGGARLLATALVSGAALAGGVALMQAVSGVGVVGAEGVDRARAFAPSPNNLALLLGRVLPLAVALAATRGRRGGLTWAAGWVAVALVGFGLTVTWSRGGWIAGTVAVGWLAWRLWSGRPGLGATDVERSSGGSPRPKAHSPYIFGRVASGLIVIAVCGGAIGLWLLATSGRVRSLFDADGSGLLRVSVWQSAIAMVRDHPWVGIGLDQFVYAYPAYLQAGAWREPNLSHPHQFLLDAWLRLGAVGVVAIAALWWGVWRRNRVAAQFGLGDATVRHGATAALLAVVVHGLVDNSYFVLDLAYATWATVLIHREASARGSE